MKKIFKQSLHIPLLVCGACLCVYTNHLLAQAPASLPKQGDDDIKITWHHITKTLYEVEFTNPKLKQDIAKYIDSLAKIDTYISESPYFDLFIDSTIVCIQTRHSRDGIDYHLGFDDKNFNWILGYSNIGDRIAVVSKTPYRNRATYYSPFVINTNENPVQLRFDWCTAKYEGPGLKVVSDIDDSGWCGFRINPEDYN